MNTEVYKAVRKIKLVKRRLMCDGSLVGAAVDGSIEVKGSEAQQIAKLLRQHGAELDSGGLETVVCAESSMMIALRPHYHEKDRYFLNLSGNALTFLKGSNVYGYAEADILIKAAFVRAMSMVGEFPRRVVCAIKNGEVNVHSMEFAAYTNEIPDKQRLLNDWQTMYGTSYSNDGIQTTTLCEMLSVRYMKKHVDHRQSVCLRIMTGDGKEEEAMLMAYDKAYLLRNNELEVPVDIEKRLRLDMHLHNGWFRKKKVNGRKLRTLKDLGDYVEKRYEGKWHLFIATEFDRMIKRSMMFEMWRFSPDDESLPKELRTAMWLQRLNVRVTDKARLLASKGKTALMMKQQTPDPHPYEIKIDLSPLK